MTGGPRILVVEDDGDLADLYAGWLPAEAVVSVAHDGATARELIDPGLDIAFLDRNLPDATGGDVLGWIRNRGIDTRVVMVTAMEPDFDILELGFDEYLTKPVTRTDLVRAVEAMQRRDEYQDRLRQLYALASKKAALETSKTPAELERNAEYQRLCEEFERRRHEVVETLDEGQVDWATLLRDSTLERSGRPGGPA